MTQKRTILAGGGAVALLLSLAGALEAHDFWLIPDAFRIAGNTEVEIRGQTSSRFPTSEAAVGPDRIASARILSASGEEAIHSVATSGTSLILRHRPRESGQRVVEATLRPRSVRESAESFRRYLVLEGAAEALERYEREGLLPTDSVTRRYTKYAKTLLEVGIGGPRAYHRVVGHPAEFVPLDDPAALGVGDAVSVRLLYRGEPLAGARIHAGSVPSLSSPDDERVVTLTTDAAGEVRIAIDRVGIWNIRAIHVVPSDPGSGADWDTHWVTLVFGVQRAGLDRTGADSAGVAATVNAYHAALESGDSVAALRLLTADATILESGGVETKEEYRSHHLPGDIAFARAVAREAGPLKVVVRGDVAWTTSTSVVRGTYRDRPVHSQGVELMVLERTAEGWRIAAIHWSARPLRS